MSNGHGNSYPRSDNDGHRFGEQQVSWLRAAVQIGFVLFSILLGLQFRSFLLSLTGPAANPVRPRRPVVEAYLPISSLMSLAYFVRTAVANRTNPAGLVIFSLTLVMALLVRIQSPRFRLFGGRRNRVHFICACGGGWLQGNGRGGKSRARRNEKSGDYSLFSKN